MNGKQLSLFSSIHVDCKRLNFLLFVALKANFDCEKVREKLEILDGQIQTLKEERNKTAELLEELKLSGTVSGDGTISAINSAVDSIELLPPIIRQKLIRLEVMIFHILLA